MILNWKILICLCFLTDSALCCFGVGGPGGLGGDDEEVIPDDDQPHYLDYESDTTESTTTTDSTGSTEPGGQQTTTGEEETQPTVPDLSGPPARDTMRVSRPACERQCRKNNYYRGALICDFNHQPMYAPYHQFQDWRMGCLCFKEFPTPDMVLDRCEDKEKAKLFCDKTKLFKDCFRGKKKALVQYWYVSCLFDICPPKMSYEIDYHLREPSIWGPWCIIMQKLEASCRRGNRDFDVPKWTSVDYCDDRIFDNMIDY